MGFDSIIVPVLITHTRYTLLSVFFYSPSPLPLIVPLSISMLMRILERYLVCCISLVSILSSCFFFIWCFTSHALHLIHYDLYVTRGMDLYAHFCILQSCSSLFFNDIWYILFYFTCPCVVKNANVQPLRINMRSLFLFGTFRWVSFFSQNAGLSEGSVLLGPENSSSLPLSNINT